MTSKTGEVFFPVKEERLTADEFTDLVKNFRNEIKTSKFMAPKIGESGFGEFVVEYKTPRLRKVNVRAEFLKHG